ncbi:MAG TPA: acyltransferase [Candidatus Acidoferrales bacterium]|nr:acyltransferase [Candidatus Acidoferrales bacterium]
MSATAVTAAPNPAPAGRDCARLPGLGSYVPAIDGLRAISIAFVLFSHYSLFDQKALSVSSAGMNLGELGVSVFFVISGYLITGLLLREEDCNGRIDLGRFYGRRFLRIIPAAYTFLLVILVLAASGFIEIAPHTYLASLFYFRNLIGRGHETAHLWSLAIEEQFYLLWPTSLVLLAPAKRLRVVSLLILAALPWRIFQVLFCHLPEGVVYERTDLRIDTILFGCMLALLIRTPGFSRWNTRLKASPVLGWAGCLTVVLATWASIHWPAFVAVALSLIPLGITLAVFRVIQSSDSFVGRFLCLRPVVFLGKLSYSLYLWQQLFLGPIEGRLAPLRAFPINIALAFLLALSSYYVVERPALRLKDRRFGVRRGDAVARQVYTPASEPASVAAEGN